MKSLVNMQTGRTVCDNMQDYVVHLLTPRSLTLALGCVLCCMKLELFTDHLTLTFNSSNPKAKRWRLLMEELNYTLKCAPEKDNEISDEMSRARSSCKKDL